MSNAVKARTMKDTLCAQMENRSRRIFYGRIDPYLVNGCEVVLDVNARTTASLEAVLHDFWRRILGVHDKSTVAFLYSETGITPLPYRRLLLALRYFRYLLLLPDRHYSHLAVSVALDLACQGKPSWISDLLHVFSRLAPNVHLNWRGDVEPTSIDDIMDAVKLAASTSLATVIDHSPKGRPLRGFYTDIPLPLSLRPLVDKPPEDLVAITRLVMSSYIFAVEVLRWRERYRKFVPRKWRLCRFCRLSVEDEVHALLSCTGHIELMHRRDRFFTEVTAIVPTFHELRTSPCTGLEQLWFLMRVPDLRYTFAKYVHDVLDFFATVPVYVPPPPLWEHYRS
ncbi:hypothetical protein EV421DRAFT_1787771 [Armillaria borealis]|uniref:Uncharacterized protein n=1 Tax=Armillaria borealis TaxID=47425 RepID=A0AA39JTU3_9AGAR|nr:hypothetical protein EV421DRAFT_1787771 [Armillaria borealis]